MLVRDYFSSVEIDCVKLDVDEFPNNIDRRNPNRTRHHVRQAMKSYRLEQSPRIPADLRFNRAVVSSDRDMIYVGSGKAAIALVLSYLKLKGVLSNKMTPIFVPSWLGTWVYAQMLPYAFPTTSKDMKWPVALCYHQYGFPQDMNRVLEIAKARGVIVIEDCAHAAGSFLKQQPLGTIGEFGIFSFSKFTFCFALGGILAKDPEFYDFVTKQQARATSGLRLFVNAVKFFSEWSSANEGNGMARLFDGFTAMAYSRYGTQTAAGPRALSLWLSKRDEELNSRYRNYRVLRQNVDRFGLCDHLEVEDVAPYAVPLNVASQKAPALIAELQRQGVRAGNYHFDFARCVFEPDFRQCVLVPIHSGMTGPGMDIVIRAINKCLAD